jgi:hypothetical protein
MAGLLGFNGPQGHGRLIKFSQRHKGYLLFNIFFKKSKTFFMFLADACLCKVGTAHQKSRQGISDVTYQEPRLFLTGRPGLPGKPLLLGPVFGINWLR